MKIPKLNAPVRNAKSKQTSQPISHYLVGITNKYLFTIIDPRVNIKYCHKLKYVPTKLATTGQSGHTIEPQRICQSKQQQIAGNVLCGVEFKCTILD